MHLSSVPQKVAELAGGCGRPLRLSDVVSDPFVPSLAPLKCHSLRADEPLTGLDLFQRNLTPQAPQCCVWSRRDWPQICHFRDAGVYDAEHSAKRASDWPGLLKFRFICSILSDGKDRVPWNKHPWGCPSFRRVTASHAGMQRLVAVQLACNLSPACKRTAQAI